MTKWNDQLWLQVAFLATLSLMLPSGAEITKGTLVLSDDSFLDRVISVSDDVIVAFDTRDLYQGILGSELGFFIALSEGASITVGFRNNSCLNADGVDLVIFEAGTPEPVFVEINGVEKVFLPTSADFSEGRGGTLEQNTILIDLDGFGVPAGGSISELRLRGGPGSRGSDVSGIAAINSVSVASEPPLMISRSLSNEALVLVWDSGTLVTSQTLEGIWAEVPGATSPLVFSFSGGARRTFWRILFDESEIPAE